VDRVVRLSIVGLKQNKLASSIGIQCFQHYGCGQAAQECLPKHLSGEVGGYFLIREEYTALVRNISDVSYSWIMGNKCWLVCLYGSAFRAGLLTSGAPNATDRPAAQATESISRVFRPLSRYFENSFATCQPTQVEMCTNGPS
jgi:hypothetical protein